jgi:hypothetical protein
MRFITITLIVHAAPVLRREIPDPPWGWGRGPIGDDAVPARAVAATG